MDSQGHINVISGSNPHGQSHETTLAQVAADQLGVQIEDVTVTSGDTEATVHGIGTFASRGAVVAASAVAMAAYELRSKILSIAAHLLEASPQDLELLKDRVIVRGAPEVVMTFLDIARAAAPGPDSRLPKGMHPGLEVEKFFVPETVTFGSGTHVCAVEVDEDTGVVRVLDYATVEDCGRMLNPAVVEGQVHGGIAHGIGNALLEETVYDSNGQIMTTTYMDYLLPTSTDVPGIRVGHQEFLSQRNPLGTKGAGEAGTISPPGCITSAVVDAFWPLPVELTRVPLHPEVVLKAIRDAKSGSARESNR
jgi:carbon-monoxide dehydrogenase large subunit